MSVNFTSVNLCIGEKLGDIFIRSPVYRNAEFVSVFLSETVFYIFPGEPVVSKPVEIYKLLVRELKNISVIILAEFNIKKINNTFCLSY